MELNKVIDRLKEEAKTNPVSNAVLHVFALRQRARNTVMIVSLYHKMRKEGFSYDRPKYIPLLKLLAELQLGTLIYDRKGRVKGLKDIRVTLQSLGAVSCNRGTELTRFSPKNKFIEINPVVTKPNVIKDLDLNLQLTINGKIIGIEVPKNLTKEEITLLISKLQST